ncbi:hypothetical protein EKO04_007013 [Ascochyta lentis]|uniref:Uncharacterized protein n=1 Tax=Ascochyta lentis TaxID=205686 RepID=A0A8H7MHD4_9PLEO|nr:hypothetical protein EKO04_007013 [Ascochyta lentis]
MDIHHQAPDEVFVTETSPMYSKGIEATKGFVEPERLPATIHYSTFRLPGNADQTGENDGRQSQTRGYSPSDNKTNIAPFLTTGQRLAAFKLESQAKAKLDYEEAEAAFEESKRFYHVDPDEWTAAEAQWRDWVTKRDPGSAALASGRLHVSLDNRAPWRQKEVDGAVAEARFSAVLEPQHGEKCVTCQAVQITEGDATLGDVEKLRRVTRLAHKIPRLQPFSLNERLDLVKASGGSSGESSEELHTSICDDEQAGSVQRKQTLSMVETLRTSLPKPDILELSPGNRTELSDRRESLDATKQLLRSTNDAVMLDAMMLDPALLLRARVFRQNKQTVESAIDARGSLQSMSAADRKSVAKTTAEAWELERDLLRLESIQQALRVRREWAEKGYSVNNYNSRVARIRRENGTEIESPLGFARELPVDLEDEEKIGSEEKQDKKQVAAERANTEKEKALQLQEQRPLDVLSQSEATGLNTETKRSPSPLGLVDSFKQHMQTLQEGSTQSTRGTSMFLNTLSSFHKHNFKAAQDASKSPLSEGGPAEYNAEHLPSPTTSEAAAPGNDAPNMSASKAKAKKDSKVEELIEEDGVSLKDFAAKSDKNSKGLRKLSIKAGSARPRWR